MKKKIVMFCFFVVMILWVLPVVVSNSNITKQPERVAGMGYLVIHVYTYTPGSGFHPYQGANISIRGFLYSYNGTTDADGDCFFTVHTRLFKAKIYFVKVSIDSQDRLVTKRDFIYILPRQIEEKEFLFLVLG